MLQWHHNPAPIRMLDHHRRGNHSSLSSSRAPKSMHPPMHPVLPSPTPPTPLLPPQPPQRAPLTLAQRFSPTPARVLPSRHRQATPLPGLHLVLPLAHTPPKPHFPPHRLGSLVPRPPLTPLHTRMEGTATPQAPMGHQPNHLQLDRFIGQVLGYHSHTPEPLCVCVCLSLFLIILPLVSFPPFSSCSAFSLPSDLWFEYPCHILFLSEAYKDTWDWACACFPHETSVRDS